MSRQSSGDGNDDRLCRLLKQIAGKCHVPGAQLTLHRSGETTTVVTGERVAGAPVRPGTPFPLGSVSKCFTATVAMQLVADGDLALDAPLSEYLPELAASRARAPREVTLRQVLSHTGGLVSDHEPEDEGAGVPHRYALAVRDLGDVGVPGDSFSYSNTGYVLVGHLVERIAGLDWWDAVDSFVNGPLGLAVARLGDPVVARRMAVPHVVTGGVAREVEPLLPAGWAPAGGLVGTSADLVAFALAHLDGDLVPDDLAALMRRPVEAEPFGIADGWGLGWGVYEGPGGRWAGHDGTLAGTTCSLRFHPETRTALALVTNASTGLDLWAEIVAELEVGTYEPAAVEPAPGADLDEFAGDYRNDTTCFSVRARGTGGLQLEDGTGFAAVLMPGREDVFGVRPDGDLGAAPHIGRFLRDSEGRVSAIQFSGRIARRNERAAR
nr:serine hydrolase domain-containing protein [Amycolatopsis anabasis]